MKLLVCISDNTDIVLCLVNPQDYGSINNYFNLHNRLIGQSYELDDNSVILNGDLALALSIKAGDIIDMYFTDD
ncbi:MAG: hypothetical protein HUJ51_00285 [Eggerthellaceae bacterium]|nr:hypothetical protein [Eggerthellaceae bacterium]